MKNLVKDASMGPLREALRQGIEITKLKKEDMRAVTLQVKTLMWKCMEIIDKSLIIILSGLLWGSLCMIFIWQDFKMALQEVRPSVSFDELGTYEEWNKQFGSLAT